MGLWENLKDLYFEWEDKYYDVLDRVNASVPVYAVIDPLDRVLPSFALLLLLGLAGVLGLLFFLASLLPVALKSTLTVTVLDEKGLPVENASVSVSWDGKERVYPTDEAGETVPIKLDRGIQVRIQVTAEGFEPSQAFRLALNEPTRAYKVTLLAEKREITYRFTLVGDDGFALNVPATVNFSCSQDPAKTPAALTVPAGSGGTVVVEEGCGTLRATVRAQGYRVRDYLVTPGGTLVLQAEEALPADPGLVTVRVLFAGAPVTDQPFTVTILQAAGTADGVPVETKTSTAGEASFTLAPGTYFARVHSTTRFAAATSSPFLVQAGTSKEVTVAVEERVLGEIRVKVVDAANDLPLEGARVSLKKDGHEIDHAVTERDKDAVVAFSIKDSDLYDVVVNHPDYCIKRMENLRFAENTVTARLQRYTGQCGGDLLAVVMEPDGTPVRNAIVSLYDGEGRYAGFADRVTDKNGIARFHGVENGDYQVFARKGPASGWSAIARYTRREELGQRYIVSLNIQPGTVRVTVLDQEGQPLQFARVALKDAVSGETVEGPRPVESAEGTIVFSTKADKTVFATASLEGYTDYVSRAFPVIPNDEQAVTLRLEPVLVAGDIKVRFLGLYRDGEKVSTVAPGRDYTAVFRMRVPKNRAYDSVSIHIRAGKEDAFMEQDNVYLKSINAPGAATLARGTAYFPSEGPQHDQDYQSADGSKWVTATWTRFSQGIIEVEATVHVKQTARHEENIFLYWRAFARKQDGEIVRDPQDQALGNAPSERDLYANTYNQWFQVGEETLCQQRWCFSASVLDLDTLLAQPATASFAARVGQAYKLSFTIQNNAPDSVFTYPDAVLRVTNPQQNIALQNYAVVTAQNRRIEGSALEESETAWVSAGTLAPNASVAATLFFTPRAATEGVLRIQLRSQNSIVFERELALHAAAAGRLAVQYEGEGGFTEEPPLLASGLERVLRVKVLDADTGLELEDARVKLKNRFNDVLFSTDTSVLGIATLRVPALLPGEALTLVAEKPDYEAFEQALQADPSVLAIEPETVGLAFNTQTRLEDEKTVRLVNKTSFPLRVEAIALEGDFKGLLDEQKSRDWLESQYRNLEIDPLSSERVLVRGFLSSRGQAITEPKTLEGTLKVTVRAFEERWQGSARVTASVGFAGAVDDPACFSVQPRAWQAATQGAQVTTDLALANGCSVAADAVPLTNLSAKVVWQSSALGDFALQSGASAVELRPGFYKTFRAKLEPDERVPVRLAFTPNGLASGTVQATIQFRAENPTDQGPQVLEDSVTVTIRSVNLEQCVSTNKDLVLLEPGQENQFEVTAAEACGGPVEVRLQSRLPVQPASFTLQENESRTVTVSAEDHFPGQYPVYLQVRGPGGTAFETRQMVRARIAANGCLRLNRYEYDVFDDPAEPFDGFDRGVLTNTCYAQKATATVKYDERDWGKAMEDGLLWAAVGFVYGGVSGLFSGGSATRTPVTGFAPFAAPAATPPPAAPTGLQLLGAGTGQLLTGVTAALGVTNPFQGAVLGFIAGTLYAYSQQETGELELQVLHRDLRTDAYTLLLPDAIEDTPSNDITVQPQDTRLVPDPESSGLDIEETTLLFVNQTGVTQPDAFNPLFRVLRVDGARLKPKTEYDLKQKREFEDFELENEEETPQATRFRLQFNAWRATLAPPALPPTAACKIGERVGRTGPDAVPRVRYAWDWQSIGEDTCTDAGEGLFCDATQFSIMLLQRIQAARTLLEASPPSQCPSAEGLLSERSQELYDADLDFAVTALRVQKTGSRATVTAVLESNNGAPTETDVFISVRNQATGQLTPCPEGTAGNLPTTLTSRQEVSCRFDDLPDGDYLASVELQPRLDTCGAGCRNARTDNDSLSAPFTAGPGAGAFTQCEPFSTARLAQFIAANPGNDALKTVQERLHFTANLIRDGYSDDFRKDFHDFAATKTFFQTPSYYLGPDGLGRYFSSDTRFAFAAPELRDGAGYLPAGKYEVSVDIAYANPDWRLFENGQPDANITVRLHRLAAPEPDSPFYHIPFDGLVGRDTPNGRQGYGANFRQESMEAVRINNDAAQPVETKTIPASTPVPGAWVTASKEDAFKALNLDRRGVILDVRRNIGQGDVSLVFSPSKPTPVVLEVRGGQAEKAYAFYTLSVDGQPQQPGPSLTRWDGVGMRCRDFEDHDLTEAYRERGDLHGGVGQAQCAGSFGTETYGLEWCGLRRNGAVFLKTLFFTPQDSDATLSLVDAQDRALFHAPTDTGAEVALEGTGTATLQSVQDVLDLVAQGTVCVTGAHNALRAQFFWNPAPLYQAVQPVLENAPNQCIQAFR